MTPLIIRYTNLLHEYADPNAAEVRKFREKYGAKDPAFRRRAEKLDKLFTLRPAVAQAPVRR